MALLERLILAIDFDGVIKSGKRAKIGYSQNIVKDCKKYIKLLSDQGCILVLWTCRIPYYGKDNKAYYNASLNRAIGFLEEHDILKYFSTINCNPPIVPWHTGNKIYADYYIDDLNLGGFPGWKRVYEIVMQDPCFKEVKEG